MTRYFLILGSLLLLLKAFTVHDAQAEAGMIPFSSPTGEIGGRGHWYSLRTMKGEDYWEDPAVLSDIRENDDGTFSVLGEAPISIAIALHPDWYPDDEPWRRAIDWVRQAEQMYRNSGVQVRFIVEHIAVWEEMPDVVYTAYKNLPFDEFMFQGNGADILIGLMPHMAGDPYCGVAYLDGRANVSSCSPMTLAHELGHNLGLNHAHMSGGGSDGKIGYCMEPYDDAYECEKGTIMSYAGSGRVPLFAANGYTYKGYLLGNEKHTAVEHLRKAVVKKALAFELTSSQPIGVTYDAYQPVETLCR